MKSGSAMKFKKRNENWYTLSLARAHTQQHTQYHISCLWPLSEDDLFLLFFCALFAARDHNADDDGEMMIMMREWRYGMYTKHNILSVCMPAAAAAAYCCWVLVCAFFFHICKFNQQYYFNKLDLSCMFACVCAVFFIRFVLQISVFVNINCFPQSHPLSLLILFFILQYITLLFFSTFFFCHSLVRVCFTSFLRWAFKLHSRLWLLLFVFSRLFIDYKTRNTWIDFVMCMRMFLFIDDDYNGGGADCC